MKILCLAVATMWATIWFTECQTTNPRRAKTRRVSNVKIEKQVKPIGVISGDQTGTLVSADWMKKYKVLEAKHSSIEADNLIYMEGENYRIPTEVADHFGDMIRNPSP